MSKYLATVRFYKDIERDNYEKGVTGDGHLIDSQTLRMEFTNQFELIEQMSIFINEYWGVSENHFAQWVNNECDVDRFDYDQNEDGDGNHITLDENNPDGWLARYQFQVTSVVKVEDVDFQFTTIKID